MLGSLATIENEIQLDAVGQAAVATTASALGVDAGSMRAYTVGCGMEVTPDPDFPDVTLVFDSDATIEELRNACAHVPDGHVMEETVEPIALYTGERTYGQRKIV